MNRLITILRAAHCRSTHHFFALDALPLIKTNGGRRLAGQLLRHYRPYLQGAKAPDSEFRDFRNHVIHVHQNHWGGAAVKAQQWYEQLVQSIRLANWPEVAYNAGVLSHYFTDPLMPLHTAQSDIESVIHRPLEWSVTKSYERILARYRHGGHRVLFQTSHKPGWLGDAVVQGAEFANCHYDELIKRYRLEAGTRNPPEGLDSESIDRLAELFGIALTGWAHILERAAIEANVDIPIAPLSISKLVASISMPVGWIVRRIESVSEQRAVQAIFEEFRSTGAVVNHLPAEVAVVRRESAQAPSTASRSDQVPVTIPIRESATVESTSTTVSIGQKPAEAATRFGLGMSDDLVDAPSIGPKTAKRFAGIGITTVGQFLESSPATMADQLRTRWIKTDTLVDWQDQAGLVVTVPGLCGYKAQLLVGVGCRDWQTLSSSEAESLHEKIKVFAASKAGLRTLRSSQIPSVDEVEGWIANARKPSVRRTA